MLPALTATLLATAPLVVVAPFEVKSPGPQDADLGLTMQNLMVHELAAVGIKARTEDAELTELGTVEGATHLVVGTVTRLGPHLIINGRLLDASNRSLLASVNLKGPTLFNDRRQFTSKIVEALELPMPARPDGYDVSDELARAWGAALRALKSGDPKVAKEKVSAVVEKWPKFLPAKAQLAKL